MDQTLKLLLDAEMRAEQIARQAELAREQLIQRALEEARVEKERYESRLPELHQSFREKAEVRADQTVSELKRRYEERHTQLRDLAEAREDEALEAAFNLLLDPNADD
ncbi:MAG: ATPase [Gammaproteobacteria bacterium]|nr:ATPase [Gammaproteobacteria bacterium]